MDVASSEFFFFLELRREAICLDYKFWKNSFMILRRNKLLLTSVKFLRDVS